MKLPQDLHVLVAADTPICRQSIHQSLCAFGIEGIHHAEHGMHAWDIFRTRRPFDLVITEFLLPELSGLELVVLIRDHEEHPQVPVLMVSGEAKELRGLPLEVGAVDCLMLPIDMEILKTTLRRLHLIATPSL